MAARPSACNLVDSKGKPLGGGNLTGLSKRLGAAVMAWAVVAFAALPSGAAQSAATGRVAIEIRNVRVEKLGQAFRFVHDRAFVERGGVGVTLTQGQVCFSSGLCNGQPVNYRIEANQTYVKEDAIVEPLGPEETFAYTYTGKDDNGHMVYLLFRIKVSGDRFEIMP